MSNTKERTCRECGCTDDDCSQCIEKTGLPCSWAEPDLCSACVSFSPQPGANNVKTNNYKNYHGGRLETGLIMTHETATILCGIFRNKRGDVVNFYQANNGLFPELTMEIQYNGYLHGRSWAAAYGKKTISRLAREFIEDISRNQEPAPHS